MKTLLRTLTIATATILIGLISLKCRRNRDPEPQENRLSTFSGYNIRVPEGKTVQDIINQLNTDLNLSVPIGPAHYHTCACDPTLLNIDHPEISISGKGPAQVKTESGGVGTDYSFDYGKNYILDRDNFAAVFSQQMPTVNNWDRFYPFGLNRTGDSPAENGNAVAIFDSGVTSASITSSGSVVGVKVPDVSQLCTSVPLTSGILSGLNFTNLLPSGGINTNVVDQTARKHGSNVTYLAAVQRLAESGPRFRVLPMKVLNADNKGDSFSLICAMIQAKKLGAKIFNLSLGYYGPPDPLLKSEIEKLAKDKIWVVVAAGNESVSHDAAIPDASRRNLSMRPDSSKFYPAWFAKDMKHVIAVTTVKGELTGACDGQNYSKDAVDIGVATEGCRFLVYNGPNSGEYVQGSSYATAVISGWLGMKTNLNVSDKSALLSGSLNDAGLASQVRGGKYIKAHQQN